MRPRELGHAVNLLQLSQVEDGNLRVTLRVRLDREGAKLRHAVIVGTDDIDDQISRELLWGEIVVFVNQISRQLLGGEIVVSAIESELVDLRLHHQLIHERPHQPFRVSAAQAHRRDRRDRPQRGRPEGRATQRLLSLQDRVDKQLLVRRLRRLRIDGLGHELSDVVLTGGEADE